MTGIDKTPRHTKVSKSFFSSLGEQNSMTGAAAVAQHTRPRTPVDGDSPSALGHTWGRKEPNSTTIAL